MRKGFVLCLLAVLVITRGVAPASAGDTTVVVTSSNAANNDLLVFDAAGTVIQSVPTQGAGGLSGNPGGVATLNGSIAVVNSGAQSVSLLERGAAGYDVRQVSNTASPPVSVTFGNDHLYILGTQTIESHRVDRTGVDPNSDETAALVRRHGSAAQGDLLAVVESNANGTARVTQFRIDEDGRLTQTARSPIDTPANGVAIVSQ